MATTQEVEDKLNYAVAVIGECLGVDAYLQEWKLEAEVGPTVVWL